jgi:hypothetical protein
VIPFKKYSDASKAYKQLKSDKEHPLTKVALAAVRVDTEGEANSLKVELKEGNLKADKLLKKSKILSNKFLKMDIEMITGLPTEEEKEENSNNTATKTEEEDTAKETVATDTKTSEEETANDTAPTGKKTTLTPEKREANKKRLKAIGNLFSKLKNK